MVLLDAVAPPYLRVENHVAEGRAYRSFDIRAVGFSQKRRCRAVLTRWTVWVETLFQRRLQKRKQLVGRVRTRCVLRKGVALQITDPCVKKLDCLWVVANVAVNQVSRAACRLLPRLV